MKYCLNDYANIVKKLVLLVLISAWYSISFGQTTYTVTSAADTPDANISDNVCADVNGDCTFRAAIQNANRTTDKDIITFDIQGNAPFIIQPQSPYNFINHPVIINGRTQNGYTGLPVIELDGRSENSYTPGLVFSSGATNSEIYGLSIYGFTTPDNQFLGGGAIVINTSNMIIAGNLLGLTPRNEAVGNDYAGIHIESGMNNLIGGTTLEDRNIISGNAVGIELESRYGPTEENRVIGNYIGTDITGMMAMGNRFNVQIKGSSGNQIGGINPNEGNVISGSLNESNNNGVGIVLVRSSDQSTYAENNVIRGNYIGTNKDGTGALPNFRGINLLFGSRNNIIGGNTPEARNVVSGNFFYGIYLQGTETALVRDNIIEGNFVGVQPDGNTPLPNEAGITLFGGTEQNRIGGTDPGSRNIVSGNTNTGIIFLSTQQQNSNIANKIFGNIIGLNADGLVQVPNGVGVSISGTSSLNEIGNGALNGMNVISGNSNHGVIINDGGENRVDGNFIGLNLLGDSPLGNGQSGIYIFNSTDNIIGSSEASIGNTISGNAGSGLIIAGEGSINNSVLGNYIGTDKEGNFAIPNNFGISISNASSNTIGGVNSFDRNIISGNTQDGIRVLGTSATQNSIVGNFVGTNENGTEAVANGARGIIISNGASSTIIGGESNSSGNLVSGNLDHGILLDGPKNIVQGNLIGTDISGTFALPNQNAGVVTRNVAENLIGGTDPLLRNVISGNRYGLWISNPSGPTNTIHGNYIGTDVSGTQKLANEVGVYLSNGEGTTVGGTNQGENNLISGNSLYGVFILNSSNNSIEGNYIGTDLSGSLPLGNADGISISSNSEGNLIGGASELHRNIVSGNTTNGISILGPNNSVKANFVGLNKVGAALGNGNHGVRLVGALARENLIGGTGTNNGNAISANNLNGVFITQGASNNQLFGNYIGTSLDGIDPLPNGQNGILINGASNDNIIGGLNSGEANTIANNGTSGVLITRGPQGNLDPLRNKVSGNRIFDNQISGIGLDTPGITLNDSEDADTGPNQLQNFPEIAGDLTVNGSQVSLRYFVPSSPNNSAYPIQVEFFINDGNRQGKTLLFVDQFTETDYSSGPFKTLEFSLPNTATFQQDDNISATATDANGNTSEFGSMATGFDLSLEIQGEGTVSRAPDQGTYSTGTEVTLTANPATGWAFDRWEGSLTGSTNPATITMDGDRSITAVFIQQTFSLTAETQGNGTVEIDTEADEYAYGTEVTLTANPATGWEFDRWEGDLTGSTNPAPLTMLSDRSVTAVFIQLTFSLTAETQGNGIVEIDPEADDYTYGTEVTLTAVPSTGWAFDRWEGDLTSNTNPGTVILDEERVVTAIFVEVENNLEIQTTGEGTVSRAPDQGTYSTGTEVTLTANPATGWAFDRWEGSLTGSTNPAIITMDGDRSVTAVFIQQSFGLTAETQGDGTVEIDPEADEYTYGSEVTITAVPSTGWEFDRWEGDLTGNTNPATITMDGNRSVRAVFIQQTFTLTAKIEGNGNVEIDPEADDYTYGTEVSLTALPSTGWEFDRWEGDLTGTTNPTTFTMERNQSVTAVFVESEYTLSIDIQGSGQVNRDPERTGYTHGSVVNLTANPEEGWVFVRWEGDLVGSENPNMILMDEGKTVSAIFVRPLGADLSVMHATCPGNGDGSITINPTGGTAPYQFDWGAFGTTESATMANLAAGTYPVTVTDANGLTLALEAEVLDTDTSVPVPDLSELPVIRENVIVSALTAPSATHACEGSIIGTTDIEFPIRASTTVIWTYTDSFGNNVTQEQQVVVEVDEITLYPNPVMEEGFWIAFPSASRGIRYNATLYSAGGTMIAEREFEIGESSNSFRWDIDHVDWSNGAYLLVLRSSSGVEAIKLLKQSK